MHRFELFTGDCRTAMLFMEDSSIDSVVCDPPYGISFMAKHWDYDVPTAELWADCLRVLKPGAHLLAFFSTRTYHRGVTAIEDAGFEIRDTTAWVYGSGFPKSMDVSKAIDKASGAERTEVVGVKPGHEEFANRTTTGHLTHKNGNEGWQRPWQQQDDAAKFHLQFAPATDAARQWQGWGTALKPAMELIVIARKPLIGTVAANVLAHGTGGLNIDGCRVPLADGADAETFANNHAVTERLPQSYDGQPLGLHDGGWKQRVGPAEVPEGRWPANLIHDGSDEVLTALPVGGGSAARFFYCAKASRKDRNAGCESMQKKPLNWSSGTQNPGSFQSEGTDKSAHNNHPTVKPTDLMAYLCRLVTPPGGLVFDPFMGSGSTGKAAIREGFRFIGCDLSPEYVAIAEARISHEAAIR